MSASAQENTNPSEIDPRVLQAQGPYGFITAVFQTLRRFNRQYYYGAALPPWFSAGAPSVYTGHEQGYDKQFGASDPESETLFRTAPHCIIHQYRVYPANRRASSSPDSPGGSSRQKTPGEAYVHDQPLPMSQGLNDPDGTIQPDLRSPFSDTGERPPLWANRESVPDLIRDFVNDDTVCYVTPWQYDVFVDFVIVAENAHMLEIIRRDLMLVLRTFHDRSNTGASNLAGWFYKDVSGADPDVISGMEGSYPCRTLTWRLKQTEAYAFPAQIVDEVQILLHNTE